MENVDFIISEILIVVFYVCPVTSPFKMLFLKLIPLQF